ncbi:MAG TPA: NosD domain-containing protein [Candidatus Bipolaricaulis anaerobius]|jgi:parallel beta-helix repeat protein|nr:NosD domain-containing protein [Candidatus Bipolaricaulis anaerobius]HNS24221.1 NosD domain-containing protein [Candidatus Bipolaricaulis anaerobius]
MHRAIAILLSGVALVVGAAAERGPIAILSDADFTADNGVIGGAGTPADPYLIVGGQIRVPDGELYGIRVEDTTAAFVIRGCLVSGAMDSRGAAIYLADVTGGTIEDCSVSDSINGIRIQTSRDIAVRDTFLGVYGVGFQVLGLEAEHFRHAVEPTTTVNGQEVRYYYGVSGQALEGIAAGNITLAACRNVTLRGAKIDKGDGITVAFSEGVRIENADISRAMGDGVFIVSSPGTVVVDSPRIANCAQAGISVLLSDRVWVEEVGLYANQVGLLVNGSDGVLVRNNSFAANSIGVLVTGGAQETVIQQGLFYQNSHGVEIETSQGAVVEACAFTESDVAVFIEGGAQNPRVAYSTMAQVGYGISTLGSYGVYERNLIARANIGLIFEEAYGQATPTGNTVRHNVLYRSTDALYLGTETSGTQVYENLIWDCSRAARDLGKNLWAPDGRGNWYSDYTAPDENEDGIGDLPVLFGGGGEDAAPLLDRGFYPGLPGVVGTMREQALILADAAGNQANIVARVAALPHEVFIGFQGIPSETGEDLAILFVFEAPTVSQFHMQNVFLPLDLVFFAADGAFLGRTTMEADSKDLYGAADPFTLALEAPAGRLAALGLGREVTLTQVP